MGARIISNRTIYYRFAEELLVTKRVLPKFLLLPMFGEHVILKYTRIDINL